MPTNRRFLEDVRPILYASSWHPTYNFSDDIRDYENTLEDFKKMLIMPENYSFYEDYCLKMQDKIRLKKDQIIKFGKVLDTPKEYIYETDETLGNNSNLPVATSVKKLSKFQQFLQALKDIILG